MRRFDSLVGIRFQKASITEAGFGWGCSAEVEDGEGRACKDTKLVLRTQVLCSSFALYALKIKTYTKFQHLALIPSGTQISISGTDMNFEEDGFS